MKHARSIDRDDAEYKKYFYRSPRQPFPAYFAIISCSCLVFFSGWDTFYQIATKTTTSSSDAAASLISKYIGPILFLGFYLTYKFFKNTHMTSYANFGNSYTPMEAGLDGEPRESSNAMIRFLSWIR
jgi:amino acid permease